MDKKTSEPLLRDYDDDGEDPVSTGSLHAQRGKEKLEIYPVHDPAEMFPEDEGPSADPAEATAGLSDLQTES